MSGTRHLSELCMDRLVDHFFDHCHADFSEEDAEAFFRGLYRIVDEELTRALEEQRAALLRIAEN